MLPVAAPGLRFTVLCADADGYRVQGVSASAVILGTVATSLPAAALAVATTPGGFFASTQIGATAEFLSVSAATSIAWIARTTGVWTPLL